MSDPAPAVGLPADCWQQLFGNTHPVALEIGPGRGEFLRAAAAQRPQWNFFAIEHSASRTREIEDTIARAGVGNARVLCGDATCLLPLLPAATVAAIYIQFPDPWWKRRHEKRRLWTTAFVAALCRVLVPGASVEVLTDVEQTFRLAQECLDADPGLEPLAVGRLEQHDSSFARKALRRGGVIYRSVHRRRLAGC